MGGGAAEGNDVGHALGADDVATELRLPRARRSNSNTATQQQQRNSGSPAGRPAAATGRACDAAETHRAQLLLLRTVLRAGPVVQGVCVTVAG